MKNLVNLCQLNKNDITQILEIATQMRRISRADYKKGPQLIGSVVAGIFDSHCSESVAFSLATQYLSGGYVDVTNCDDVLEMGKILDNMGVNTIVLSNKNDNIVHSLSNNCSCRVINGGSSNSDPIGVLADIMALMSRLDGISNLNILIVGNKYTNKVQELAHVLEMFGSSLLWYLPADDFVTTKRGIVIDKIDVAFKGADAVIDLGLTGFSQIDKYYGTNGGISLSLMDKCRIDAPLLGTRTVVDNVGIREYQHNLVNVRHSCYVSIAMSVLYLLSKKN